MKRELAKFIHEATNITYWIEKPEWNTGRPLMDAGCEAVRKLPFSAHDFQRRLFFRDNLIAVNGESVVARHSEDTVHKYMFRYPGKMKIRDFEASVATEIDVVTEQLGGVALPTSVTVYDTNILRFYSLHAVTQTQPYLSMDANPSLNGPEDLVNLSPRAADLATRDLETMLIGIDSMFQNYGLHPDIADSAGNLRINPSTGKVFLIDVMPVYENGGRLIGGMPYGLLEHAQENADRFREHVGSYGA